MPPFSGEKIYSNSPLNNIENFWVSCIHKCIDSPEYYANFKNNLEEVKQTYSLEYVQKKWIDFFHEAENLFVGNL
jgi:hypothetical protein